MSIFEEESPSYPVLRCLDTVTGETHEIPVQKPVFTIGRSLVSDLHLPNQRVSSTHARIERRGQQYFWIDTSYNGSRVAGESVHNQEAPLDHEDIITICPQGYYQLTFILPNGATSTKTATDLFPYHKISVRLELASYLYHHVIYRNLATFLFGVSGSGKSHLLEALANPTLQEHFHQSGRLQLTKFWKTRPVMVYFDGKVELTENTPNAFIAAVLQTLRQKLDYYLTVTRGVESRDWSSLGKRLDELASQARNVKNNEALPLLMWGLRECLEQLQVPLVLLLDGLLEQTPPAFWRDLTQALRNPPSPSSQVFVRLLIASRYSLETWQNRLISLYPENESLRLHREIQALQANLKVLALEGPKEEESLLIANYCLILNGGAPATRQDRLETAFERTPQGCYRNGMPIDGSSFQFIAGRINQLAGRHPGLIQVLAQFFIQKIEPPQARKGLPDLRSLANNPQAEAALLKRLVEDTGVGEICAQIYDCLSAEQIEALTTLSWASLPTEITGRNAKIPATYHNQNFDWTGYQVRGLVFPGLQEDLPYPVIFSPVFGLYLLQRQTGHIINNKALPEAQRYYEQDVLALVRQHYQPQQCWLTVDTVRRTVSICGLPPILVSSTEIWRLLKYLYENPNQVIDKMQLVDYMYGQEGGGNKGRQRYDESDIRRFEAVVKRLRQQIEPWREEKVMVFLVNRHNAFEFCPGQAP